MFGRVASVLRVAILAIAFAAWPMMVDAQVDIRTDVDESAEIVFFGLLDHVTGQGLGRWFLGAAIEAAWSRHPSKVRLQTCSLDHPAALPLYQRMGFVPVARVEEKIKPLTLSERSKVLFR